MLRTHSVSLLGSSIAIAAVLTAGAAHAQPTEDPPLIAPAEPLALRPPAPAAPPEAHFAWGDFTWMNGQSRQKDFPLKAFNDAVTLSLYLDTNYAYSLNHPRDNTFTGTASVPRHNEFNVNLASVGLEWNYKNVIGRLSLQYGSIISIVQDLDGTTARGRNNAVQNLRYIREATAGYHFDALHGVNVEGGIFMSYIGLESFLLAENWNYTRSVVCEHTPFYFQGMRVQIFPSDRVKIEPWLMNGWQTYGKYNFSPSGGLALRYQPFESLGLFANFYLGTDTRNQPQRLRFHHDSSVVWRLFESVGAPISRVALSLNSHLGLESGGVGLPGPDRAHFLAATLAMRAWFIKELFAFTARGEVFKNGTAYLAQFAPPDFTPGVNLVVWGVTGTLEFMPRDYFSLRLEVVWRESNQRYFAGAGGTTSPTGFQGDSTAGWVPDTVRSQVLGLVAANFRL